MKKIMFFTVFILSACNVKIEDTQWLYVEGAHIGDVLDFRGGYYRVDEGDLILRVDSDSIVGRILNYKRKKLTIVTKAGEEGIYKYIELGR